MRRPALERIEETLVEKFQDQIRADRAKRLWRDSLEALRRYVMMPAAHGRHTADGARAR
jgi:hypothetical protein